MEIILGEFPKAVQRDVNEIARVAFMGIGGERDLSDERPYAEIVSSLPDPERALDGARAAMLLRIVQHYQETDHRIENVAE